MGAGSCAKCFAAFHLTSGRSLRSMLLSPAFSVEETNVCKDVEGQYPPKVTQLDTGGDGIQARSGSKATLSPTTLLPLVWPCSPSWFSGLPLDLVCAPITALYQRIAGLRAPLGLKHRRAGLSERCD